MKLLDGACSEHDATDSLFQDFDVEIHDQTNSQIGGSQVAHHLSDVDRNDAFNRLDLQHQPFVDKDIQALMADHAISISYRD